MDTQERGRERLRKLRAELKKGSEKSDPVVPGKLAKAPKAELALDELEPNDWNPNVVEKPFMVKLKNGISRLLEQGLRPPPITVRRLPSGRYQIIDGYHRWTVFKELKQQTIPAYVLNVDEKDARILTDMLNYLRGRPDEQKYSEGVAVLVRDHGLDIDELSSLLPETRDELVDILEASDSGLEALLLIEEKERAAAKEADAAIEDDNTWLDVTFRVSKSQAKVIEAEVTRIEKTLDGKNRRGRALEYMAVMSSQTPLDQHPKTNGKKKPKAA